MGVFEFYLLASVAIIAGVPLLVKYESEIKCARLGHVESYAGRKSGMTFKEGGRGVVGSMRDIHKCGRCGKRLDY